MAKWLGIYHFSFGIQKEFTLSSFIFGFFILMIRLRLSIGVMTVHEQDLHGEVEAGNYSYYSLKSDVSNGQKAAAVVLLLFPLFGDADLYVSRSNTKPTYEHGQHDFQSTSCGIDRVDINLNAPKIDSDIYDDVKRTATKFGRTLTVGVYGHPSHPLSRYLLKVLLFMDDVISQSNHLSINRRLSDDDYMTDEMHVLALTDRWREWVQQVHVSEDEFFTSLSNSSATFSATVDGGKSGEGFRELLRSVSEILLAILSFILNILVEVMV